MHSFIIFQKRVIQIDFNAANQRLEPLRETLMEQSDVIVIALQGAIIGAWYTFSRWLEPKLPDWLSRILMGSASQPTYDKPELDQEVIHDEPESDQEVTYGLGN